MRSPRSRNGLLSVPSTNSWFEMLAPVVGYKVLLNWYKTWNKFFQNHELYRTYRVLHKGPVELTGVLLDTKYLQISLWGQLWNLFFSLKKITLLLPGLLLFSLLFLFIAMKNKRMIHMPAFKRKSFAWQVLTKAGSQHQWIRATRYLIGMRLGVLRLRVDCIVRNNSVGLRGRPPWHQDRVRAHH